MMCKKALPMGNSDTQIFGVSFSKLVSDTICISFLCILAVNNVGMSYPSPYYLLEIPDREEVRDNENLFGI